MKALGKISGYLDQGCKHPTLTLSFDVVLEPKLSLIFEQYKV